MYFFNILCLFMQHNITHSLFIQIYSYNKHSNLWSSYSEIKCKPQFSFNKVQGLRPNLFLPIFKSKWLLSLQIYSKRFSTFALNPLWQSSTSEKLDSAEKSCNIQKHCVHCKWRGQDEEKLYKIAKGEWCKQIYVNSE